MAVECGLLFCYLQLLPDMYCIGVHKRIQYTDSQAGLHELQHIVTELSLVCQYVVVAGDLNIDLCSSSTIATAYSKFVSDDNLVQHIAEPSRVTATSATLTDHILTTPNIVVDFVVSQLV